MEKLNRDAQSGKSTPTSSRGDSRRSWKSNSSAQQADREGLQQLERTARLVNMVLPVGWLPLGVMTAAEGSVLPSILGLLGMTLIGSASLCPGLPHDDRTVPGAVHQPQRPAGAAPSRQRAGPDGSRATSLLEAQLPGLSEPVSAVALAGLRSLLRSPEAKMMLLTPVIMSVIFGSMLWRSRQQHSGVVPAAGRHRRDGLRALRHGAVDGQSVRLRPRRLSRVRAVRGARRDILLGKNLSFAPLVLGMAAIVLAIVAGRFLPCGWDHFLAMIPQYISMFLLFCMLMNLLSIYAPVYVAAGSLKPSNPKLTTVLLHLVTFMVFFPLTQAVTLMPLGTEIGPATLGLWLGHADLPVALAGGMRAWSPSFTTSVRDGLGSLLQSREQKILETVTAKAA